MPTTRPLLAYAITLAFFVFGALMQGYFEAGRFSAAAALLFTAAIYYAFSRNVIQFNLFHLGIFLYVGMYATSVIYAADLENAILEAGRVALLLPLALVLMFVNKSSKLRLYLNWSRILAGVAVIGLLFRMERQGRLESTIAYANAFAILLLVSLLISVLFYVQSQKLNHLITGTFAASGLLLTMSRSVWVLWMLTALAALVLFPELRRRSLLVAVGLVHIAGWMIAALYRGDAFFFMGRVQSIRPETSELQIRLVYWKDGLRMLRDYIGFGSGGGGWSLLQLDYQSPSHTYFVRYIHNFYLQTALDIGLLGLVAIAVIGYAFASGIRIQLKRGNSEDRFWAKGTALAVALIAIHAGFDFDLSFPLLSGSILLFMSEAVSELKFTIPVRKIKATLGIGALCVALFFGWLAIGSMQKQTAIQLRDSGNLDAAEPMFQSAANMIPWSSSIRYESAKLHVLRGNALQSKTEYNIARAEVTAAVRLQPKEKLYADLLSNLSKPE